MADLRILYPGRVGSVAVPVPTRVRVAGVVVSAGVVAGVVVGAGVVAGRK
jgi:hypothetical protein